MSIRRPRIFISSTISDLRDLRSSLKYYLEELGYQVLLSEFNDFEKPLDENSIQACIETIESSAIYILLIGSRAGGLYSQEEGITITQYEYRNAYDLFKQGQIRIILFVRDEIWKLKGDRESLSRCIKNNEVEKLSQEQRRKIIYRDGPYIEDAELIFNFIDEIAKSNEMKKAVKGESEYPKGNWIHSFSNFKDVIDVLKVELNIKYDIGRIAGEINLKRELASNLEKTIERFGDGKMIFSPMYVSKSKNFLPESLDVGFCTLPSQEVIRIIMFSIYSQLGNSFSSQFLDRALESGDFLIYDKDEGVFKPSKIHESLIELKKQLNQAKYISSYIQDVFVQFHKNYKKLADSQKEVKVDCHSLLVIIGYSNVIQNICNLSVAIYQALIGNNTHLSKLEIIPASPFPDEAEKIEKEHFKVTDIQNILENMLKE